jgi:hypothetical protein
MAVESVVFDADGESASETPGATYELVHPDTVVRVLATTIADQLTQPLAVLMATLELWRMGHYAGAPPTAIQERLEQATEDLARRVELFARARHYTPQQWAGFGLLDLQHAGDPAE